MQKDIFIASTTPPLDEPSLVLRLALHMANLMLEALRVGYF